MDSKKLFSIIVIAVLFVFLLLYVLISIGDENVLVLGIVNVILLFFIFMEKYNYKEVK